MNDSIKDYNTILFISGIPQKPFKPEIYGNRLDQDLTMREDFWMSSYTRSRMNIVRGSPTYTSNHLPIGNSQLLDKLTVVGKSLRLNKATLRKTNIQLVTENLGNWTKVGINQLRGNSILSNIGEDLQGSNFSRRTYLRINKGNKLNSSEIALMVSSLDKSIPVVFANHFSFNGYLGLKTPKFVLNSLSKIQGRN